MSRDLKTTVNGLAKPTPAMFLTPTHEPADRIAAKEPTEQKSWFR